MLQSPIMLSTGSIARLPIQLKREFKTRAVEFMDGTKQRFQDLATERRMYSMNLNAMKETEKADWLELYRTAKGGFNTFTFVSPIENLLLWSEQVETTPSWVVGPELAIGKNYIIHSEEFDDASWVKTQIGTPGNPVVTPNNQTAPDGAVNVADTIDFPATGAGEESIVHHDSNSRVPDFSSQTFTFSVFLKAASAQTIWIDVRDGLSSTTEAKSVTTAWQRFTITHTTNASPTVLRVQIKNNPSEVAKTVYAWGAQIEYGNAASDYTSTTTAAVELKIADPFWQQAPAGAAGSSDNLNSSYRKRGRQIVILGTATESLLQSLAIDAGGNGSSRTQGLAFVLSCYFKRQGATAPTINLILDDTNSASENFKLPVTPSSSWVRVSKASRFSASNNGQNIRVIVGDSSAAGTFYLFGLQLQTGEALTDYMGETTTKSGVMTAAFQNDSMSEKHVVFGLSNVSDLEIVEEL